MRYRAAGSLRTLSMLGLWGVPAAAQSITGLGLPSGQSLSEATAVSADGNWVAGYSAVCCTTNIRNFRWSRAGGMEDLGHFGAGNGNVAKWISVDGSVIAGHFAAGGGSDHPFRWVNGTYTDLGLPAGSGGAQTLGASGDGSTLVGYGYCIAWRWKLGEGFLSLPRPAGLTGCASAWGISGNGSVIVGGAYGAASSNGWVAVRWTNALSASPIPEVLGVPPGADSSFALGVSPDGQFVFGDSPHGSHPYRLWQWGLATGQNIISDDLDFSNGYLVLSSNHDGSVLVRGHGGAGAYYWTAALGWVNLMIYLPTRGVDLTGWAIGNVAAISADGLTLVGNGLHNGVDEAYVVTLPASYCYANCDGSSGLPALNAYDFQCFLNKFVAEDPWANCDLSSAAPTLNVNDFQCFLNAYAVGCP